MDMSKKMGKQPLPDGHPFKGGCIILGSSIPEAWKERFRKKKQEPSPEQPDDLEMETDKDPESDKEE